VVDVVLGLTAASASWRRRISASLKRG